MIIKDIENIYEQKAPRNPKTNNLTEDSPY